MAQRLKDEVRQRILSAASECFSRNGYLRTSLAEIAQKADIATSNLYKYYANKEALFDAVVSVHDAAQLLRLLRARLRELRIKSDWSALNSEGSMAARRLMEFWISKRLTTVILLDGANGTRYQRFRPAFVGEMRKAAARQLCRPGAAQDPVLGLLLETIFENTVTLIVTVLREHENEADVHRAIAAFWSYQLAGLQALSKHIEGDREEAPHI